MNKKALIKGTLWKFFERAGVFGTQFIVQVILARLLSPSDYGALAIMVIFITISNVLIQTGFSTTLVQRKDIEESDYSSVFWVSLLLSAILYILIYLFSPVIARIYDSPELIWPLRVIAIVLFPGAFNSLQLAKVTKELDFRKIFYSNLSGAVVSGVFGVMIAIRGGGLWALVYQYLVNTVVSCIVMRITVKIDIRFYIDFSRIKVFLSYGWKLIVSGILNTISEQINSILIGYKFSTESLGYYTRGMQFPNYGISIIQDTMTGILLPAISKVQDQKTEAKLLMRNALLISSYLVFPMMGGLAIASGELISVFLTDKWMGCVPYICLFCGVFALYPVHVCNLQTLNALGRSDLFLMLEIIKKVYSISLVIITMLLSDTPLAVVICTLIISPVGWFVNSFPTKKLIDYGFFEQAKDLFPTFINTVIMMIIVYSLSYINIEPHVLLIIKVFIGIISYVLISVITKNKQFYKIKGLLNHVIRVKQGD